MHAWCADDAAEARQVDGRVVGLLGFSFLVATIWHLRDVHELELDRLRPGLESTSCQRMDLGVAGFT